MKKALSLVLGLCIVLSVCIISVSALAESNWAMKYVDFCINNNMFRNKTRTGITTTEKIKRQEVVYALMKIEGVDWSIYDEPAFSDVAEASYYNGAINWAYSAGIVTGYSDGLFHPSDPVRKQDILVMIYRYLVEYKNIVLPSDPSDNITSAFTDDDLISTAAKPKIEALYDAGIVTGNANGQLLPTADTTTIEATAFLTRTHGYRHNTDGTINVCVQTQSGIPLQNAAVVFCREFSANSYGDNTIFKMANSSGVASLNVNTERYVINAMSQYTSDFSADYVSASRLYVMLILPADIDNWPLTDSYDDTTLRSDIWGHGRYSSCKEARWAFPQWCPTALMDSGQNFGWRYNGGIEFHQGMDYGCYMENIYNTTDYQLKVFSCGDDTDEYDQDTRTYNQLGKYVKVWIVGTDKYLIFQHLNSYSVEKDDIIDVDSDLLYPFAVTGNTGGGAWHLHLTMTNKQGHVYYPSAYVNAGNKNFLDPRIYFK